MKDELGGQIMKKLVGLRPKTYSYLKDNNDKGKKTKNTKSCATQKNPKISGLQELFKSFSYFEQS